jgi:FAD/FMN-containing dehydrogenase
MTTTAGPAVPVPAISGRLVRPGDPDWDGVRQAFNTTLDVRPAAVALPADAHDVAALVRHARAHGLRIAPQATAHNAGPLGDALERTMIVSVRHLDGVSIDPVARRVRVGAGVKWMRVTPGLSEHGLAGLHGSSPDVGIAGYSLGGGMGWLARRHGMQTNSVTAIELVTADGRLRRVDAEHEPDLFWALRGGGGNFGVVTAIEFAVYPCEELYAGALFFPFERSADVLHTWRELLPALPDEMMTWATMMHLPDLPIVPEPYRARSWVVVMAAFLGEEAEGRSLLAPLRRLGAMHDTLAMVPPIALAELAMDPPDPLPFGFGASLLHDVGTAGMDALLAEAGPGSASGTALTMVQLRHMGGALNRPPASARARATLPGDLCLATIGVAPDDAAMAVV